MHSCEPLVSAGESDGPSRYGKLEVTVVGCQESEDLTYNRWRGVVFQQLRLRMCLVVSKHPLRGPMIPVHVESRQVQSSSGAHWRGAS